MKSLLWIGVVLVIISLGTIPFHQKKSLLIKARYEIVYDQLLKPTHWKSWQPDVKASWQHDSTKVHITNTETSNIISAPDLQIETRLNGFGLKVRKNIKGKSEQYSFTMLADKNFRFTDVYLIGNTSGFKWLINLVTQKSLFVDIEALKHYVEDSKAYYGFQIDSALTIDTNILVVKKVVPLKDKASAIIAARSHLQAYIGSHHYKITQPVMADIHDTDRGDSVRIMMGMPITESPKTSGDIMLMQMPKQSRQIYINYSGRYKDRLICYNALKRYIADNSLSTTEAPYEKYLDNKIPLNDTAYTRMQIICPVQ
jgi:effector-binding domain-containing protein